MRGFIQKALVIGLVIGSLLIAGGYVRSIVTDRIANRASAQQSIAASLAESQTLAGPVLRVRYAERFTKQILNDKGERVRQEEQVLDGEKLVLPETLQLSGNLRNDTRYRGVFRINTYLLEGGLQSTLRMPTIGELPRSQPDSQIEIKDVHVLFALNDPRGLRKLDLSLDGQALMLEAGTGLKVPASGAQARIVEFQPLLGKTLGFKANLQLAGTDSFAMLPLGHETTVSLRSDWPHPSFSGRFLPVSRQVNAKGFEA